jgi:hypothetical protein
MTKFRNCSKLPNSGRGGLRGILDRINKIYRILKGNDFVRREG